MNTVTEKDQVERTEVKEQKIQKKTTGKVTIVLGIGKKWEKKLIKATNE